jgi:hypothetical protein
MPRKNTCRTYRRTLCSAARRLPWKHALHRNFQVLIPVLGHTPSVMLCRQSNTVSTVPAGSLAHRSATQATSCAQAPVRSNVCRDRLNIVRLSGPLQGTCLM